MGYIALVQEYYRSVDASDFEPMLALFSDDIVYDRCEKKISGMAELRTFYLEHRKLVGKHKINSIFASGEVVVVRGVFHGKEKLVFADFFEFKHGKIIKRQTYLADCYDKTV